MVGCHVAHDCKIENNVILVNNASLAGHVVVEDFAIIGALSGVHQFCRIGKHSMIGAMSGIDSDVIPYGTVLGNRAFLSGLNIIGLKRRVLARYYSRFKAYGVLFVMKVLYQTELKKYQRTLVKIYQLWKLLIS